MHTCRVKCFSLHRSSPRGFEIMRRARPSQTPHSNSWRTAVHRTRISRSSRSNAMGRPLYVRGSSWRFASRCAMQRPRAPDRWAIPCEAKGNLEVSVFQLLPRGEVHGTLLPGCAPSRKLPCTDHRGGSCAISRDGRALYPPGYRPPSPPLLSPAGPAGCVASTVAVLGGREGEEDADERFDIRLE